ncbi:DUF3817 domain-containing protein [Dietzia sp.]|uniref:DUF3817 domain-containing protein n=1 Tax=Dietzia sp. TaxID=1871616 RepID=UPI002FD9541E
MGPVEVFRKAALAEVVTWTLLILGMIGKYAFDQPWATSIGGGIHGFVFLCFVVVVVFLAIDQKWSAGTTVLGLVCAVIPYMSIWYEKSMLAKGKVSDPWRLGAGGEAPAGPLEKVAAGVLRRPVTAILVALAVVVVVFVVLLVVGPPFSSDK